MQAPDHGCQNGECGTVALNVQFQMETVKMVSPMQPAHNLKPTRLCGNVDFIDYLTQIKAITQFNIWNEEANLIILLAHLIGSASGTESSEQMEYVSPR